MLMKFTKMQGIGNDYVYVDVTKAPLENAGEVAKKVSDRHFGIGSDGLILIASSKAADFRMIMYNADGSEGAMCGNGIRCVGKFVYDKGMTDKEDLAIETKSGIKYLHLTVRDGKVTQVRVDMGEPILEAEKIPVKADKSPVMSEPITVEGRDYLMSAVSMGNPHCVVFIDSHPKDFPLEEIGPGFESHVRFPDRVNTEFIQVVDDHTLNMRVWERGAAETLACGTGACAAAVAAILNGYAKSPVLMHLVGGDLTIEWEGQGRPVYMTGPAETVFEGEIEV